jgi:5-methylcytosine-specific restriction endonuclease McrA
MANPWNINLSDYDKKGKKVRVSVPSSTIKDVCIRAEGKCENPSCKDPSLKGLIPQMHHKNRDTKNNDPSNLQLLCPNCHSRKHKKDKLIKPRKPTKPKNPYARVFKKPTKKELARFGL